MDLVPDRHFIHDLVILSTLNRYGEVMVGDKMYHLFDDDHTIIVTDPAILSTVRAFKGSGYTNIEELYQEEDVVAFGFTVNGVEQEGNVCIWYNNGFNEEGAANKTTNDLNVNFIRGNVFPDDCNGKKIYVKNHHLFHVPTATQVKANYYIDWDDGTGSQSLGSLTSVNANHTYAANGTYTVIITAFVGATDVYSFEEKVTVTNTICAGNEKSKQTTFYHGGGWAVRGYIANNNGPIWFRVNATSESFLNGKKTKCQHLVAKVYGDILVNNNSCSLDFYGSAENGSEICKEISTALKVGHKYRWLYLEGCHAIKGGEDWYPRYHDIEPCD